MASKFTPRRPGSRPTECRQCGVPASGEVRISLRGLCIDCAIENVRGPAQQLIDREGPAYDQWLASTLDAMHRLASR